jgi:hypothetical protein
MTAEKKLTRRRMLQVAALFTPAVITGCATLPLDMDDMDDMENMAGEPLVQSGDPVARAVLYYPNSGDVPADHPLAVTHKPEQNCAQCVHVRGAAGDGARECPVFPGRRVNAAGWCSVWAQG